MSDGPGLTHSALKEQTKREKEEAQADDKQQQRLDNAKDKRKDNE